VTRGAALLSAVAAAACGGGDGGGGDGGPGLPFGVAEREWSWVPVAGNRCMDGSETGIGVDLDARSGQLVVFLEGGGGCFNEPSCASVAHQDGYGPDQMADFAGGAGGRGIFDRGDPANPLAGWSYVLVPYCSGDTHAGASEEGAVDGRVHDGFGNLSRAMELVAGELDAASGGLERVLLTGQSAGGFGATIDFDQVQQIFGDVPVDLIDDSGPPLADATMTPCLQTLFRGAWNLAATIPADCAACTGADGGGLVNLVPFLSTKYPASRFGLISSLRDRTMRQVYGYGYPDCDNPTPTMPADAFAAGVAELRDDVMAALPGTRAFTIDSDVHVWTSRPLGETQVAGVSLGSWIADLVSGAEPWESVIPPD
jgi:hypothetical protein